MALDFSRIARRLVGHVRTAGTIEFKKDTGPVRRDLRAQGFKWEPEALRNLAKILWATQRAHSYAIASLRLFSKMPSSQFSPDGLLGGRGYIQSIKEMRSELGQSVEILSSFTDTIHDEVNAEHWANSSDTKTDEIVQDAQEVKSNPEQFVQEEFPEDEAFQNPDAEDMNPQVLKPEREESEEPGSDEPESQQSQVAAEVELKKSPKGSKKDEPASQLPSDDVPQKHAKTEAEAFMHTTTPDHGSYASAFKHMLDRVASVRQADSSLPVETLPGPRVTHIGPAAGNEAGHFNDDEVWPSDDKIGEGLGSGINDSKCLSEGPDANMDGVTGYDNLTDGSQSTFASVAARLAANTYSWLPGTSNEKNMNYYELGLSAADIEWMRAHNEPDPPFGTPKPVQPTMDWLWDPELIK